MQHFGRDAGHVVIAASGPNPLYRKHLWLPLPLQACGSLALSCVDAVQRAAPPRLPGKWIVTNVSDTKYELAYTKAATKLLKYFKVGGQGGARLWRAVPSPKAAGSGCMRWCRDCLDALRGEQGCA